MKNLKRYETPHDVHMRLHHTICLWEGLPVWVRHEDDSLNVSLYGVRSDDVIASNVDSSDPRLDITSVPLGYTISTKKSPLYVYRLPLRQQKQGVCNDNVAYLVEQVNKVIPQRGLPISGNRLADLIEGVYPNIDLLQKVWYGASKGFPFHRKYCIVRGTEEIPLDFIKFCGQTMGFFDVPSKTAYLLPPFHEAHHRAVLYKFGVKSETINHADDVS